MAATGHADINEALILIGAALTFTVEKWDEFVTLTEMENGTDEEKKVVKDIQENMMQLAAEIHQRVERREAVEAMMEKIAPFLFG